MALVNPNIAMSYRGVEVPQQNALADYAAVQQIQSGQRQAEAAQMQMQRMRQTDAALEQVRQVAMKNGGPGDLNEIANAYLQAPDREMQQFGIGLIQKLKERAEFNEFGKKNYPDLFGAAPAAAAAPANAMAPAAAAAPVNAMAPAAAPASEPYPGYNEFIGMTPSAAPARAQQLSPTGKTRQQLEGMIFMAQGNPLYKGMAETAKLELAEMMRTPVYHNVSGVGLVNPITKEVLVPSKAAPAAPPSMVAEYNFAKTTDGGGFKGSFQDFVTARAAAGRAPVQPVAPTITTIVDPLNPNQMLTIDARRYQQGGGAGSPGVIGVAGKEPGAALRQNKVEAGKTQLADDLDNLRASFEALDKMRSIPSTERNALSNVASGIAATGIGQKTGQLFGTEAQVERDVINSARTRLVNSIKNATGMSAQQLNSNVELQTMLKSISDPGQSVQAALRIIDDIDNAYVKGDGKLPKRGAAPAPAAAANVVVTPDGQSHTFPTPAAAAAFKKAAGL